MSRAPGAVQGAETDRDGPFAATYLFRKTSAPVDALGNAARVRVPANASDPISIFALMPPRLAPVLGLVLALLAPAAAQAAPSTTPSTDALVSLVVLGLACTAAAFLLWFALITEVGPSRATLITYVNPIVAVALGVALLGESLTFAAVAGLLLILAGSWLATGGGAPPGLNAALGRSPRPRPG